MKVGSHVRSRQSKANQFIETKQFQLFVGLWRKPTWLPRQSSLTFLQSNSLAEEWDSLVYFARSRSIWSGLSARYKLRLNVW